MLEIKLHIISRTTLIPGKLKWLILVLWLVQLWLLIEPFDLNLNIPQTEEGLSEFVYLQQCLPNNTRKTNLWSGSSFLRNMDYTYNVTIPTKALQNTTSLKRSAFCINVLELRRQLSITILSLWSLLERLMGTFCIFRLLQTSLIRVVVGRSV